jgi:hypothetical protein
MDTLKHVTIWLLVGAIVLGLGFVVLLPSCSQAIAPQAAALPV